MVSVKEADILQAVDYQQTECSSGKNLAQILDIFWCRLGGRKDNKWKKPGEHSTQDNTKDYKNLFC